MFQNKYTKLLAAAIYFFVLPYTLYQINHITIIPFILFVLVSVNVGIFFTLILNSILKTNLYTFILYSSFFGLTIFTLVVLIWGQFGQNINFNFLAILFYVFSLLSFSRIVYMILRNITLNIKVRLPDCNIVDLLFLVTFVSLFLYCILIIMNYFYIEYDNFTFWVTDAKIIYLTNYLRNTKDIISAVNYTSYYPLQSVYLFHLFDALKEQYAAFITIWYCLIATLLVYLFTLKKTITTKFLVGLSLILINSIFIYNQNSLFTSYAEAIAACFIVVISLIIIKTITNDKSRFIKLGLVLLLLYAFCQIKFFFFYYAIILFVIYIVTTEYSYIRDLIKLKKIPWKDIRVLIAPIVVIVLFEISKRYYFTNIWQYDTEGGSADPTYLIKHTKIIDTSSVFLVDYITAIINILITKYNWLFVIFILGIIFPFFNKNFKYSRNTIYLWFMALITPLAFFVLYLKTQVDLTNMSIVRYITLGIFLMPMMFQAYNLDLSINKYKDKVVLVISLVCIALMYIILTSRIPIDFYFHTGEYKDYSFLNHSYKTSEYIKTKLPDNERILVAASHTGLSIPPEETDIPLEYISNIDYSSRYLRYFLFDRNQNGAYIEPLSEFAAFLEREKVNYIAIFLNSAYTEREKKYREYFNIKDHDYPDDTNLVIMRVINEDNKIQFESI